MENESKKLFRRDSLNKSLSVNNTKASDLPPRPSFTPCWEEEISVKPKQQELPAVAIILPADIPAAEPDEILKKLP